MFNVVKKAATPANISILASLSLLGCASEGDYRGNHSAYNSTLYPTTVYSGQSSAYNGLANPPMVFTMRPMPEVKEDFSTADIVAKIPELRKISPKSIADIEREYRVTGGLTNPAALNVIKTLWVEHLQTESMLADLKNAGKLAPTDEASLRMDPEIPFQRINVHKLWEKLPEKDITLIAPPKI